MNRWATKAPVLPRLAFVSLLGGLITAASPGLALQIRASHGTLIVPVLTKHALVACSDRRRLTPGGTHIAVKKAFPAGSNGFYVAAGSTGVSIGGPSRPSFDVHSIVQAFFRGKERLTVDDVVPALPLVLTGAVAKVFDEVEPQAWLQRPASADPDLFRIVVFLATGGTFASADVTIRLDLVGTKLVPRAVQGIERNYTSRFQLIGGSGTLVMGQQLLDPHDSVWADVRSDPLMAKILLTKGSIRNSLSVIEAERFSRGLIRVVGTRKARLGFEDDVSPESDCLLLQDDGTLSHP